MPSALKYLVIHCTATGQGVPVSASSIRRWHTSPPPLGNGWKQVGYTDMFHLDGNVERLVDNNEDAKVDPWEITNGAAGYNGVSRHVVYVGGVDASGKPMDSRTSHQRAAMRAYVLDFVKANPQVKVCGHYQLNAGKACPSFDVPAWLRALGVPEQNIY